LLLSVSDVAGTYEEQNNTATNPYVVFPDEDVEFDWIVQHNNADDKSSYCFRMVESDGTPFQTYNYYPVIRTVGYEPLVTNWRWYDDANSLTPSTPLAGENIAPSNIANQNEVKLRVVLRESSAADGVDVKFALQYSEYADFSQSVHTLTSTSTCASNSIWCFTNGAGTDNAVIQSSVISSADSCVAGVGTGCGTHNESANPAGVTFDQPALTDTEFEFALKHAGARSNRVYYFRLYNLTYSEVVGVADTFSSPSLVTEGAALGFSVAGLNSNTLTGGITTDATTTATAVAYGQMSFDIDKEAAQRISINTNATQGYQVLLATDQQLTNSFSQSIPQVTGTNSSPSGWSTGCLMSASGCFGYHSTDATLDGGSSRFGPLDSYAALDTVGREIMYSSVPTSDTQDIIYKIRVSIGQQTGQYTANIVYIAVPVH
jgi:hypothetical protein